MNKMIVFVGPRGVGKDTLARHLEAVFDKCKWAVATTTRDKRPGEVETEHYFYITNEEFAQKIKDEDFVEWDHHFNAYYGTSRSMLEDMWSKGQIPVKDIDFKGATKLKKILKDSILVVFVKTSSFGVLEERIRLRGIDNPKLLESELRDAKERYAEEVKFEKDADITVINDDLDRAKYDIEQIAEKYIKV